MEIFKQKLGSALFPDIEWSKPENSNLLGKLLIVGGSANNIADPSSAYQQAIDFGISNARVIVPISAKRNMPMVLPFIEFAPSNPSGSFSKNATAIVIDFANQSDCCLLCGNFGKNSETAIMIENLLEDNHGLITITGDGVDYFVDKPDKIINRPNTIIVASFSQLQKIVKNSPITKALLYSDNMAQNLDALKEFAPKINSFIITEKDGVLILICNQGIVTSKIINKKDNWQLNVACLASFWSMINKNKLSCEVITCHHQFFYIFY